MNVTDALRDWCQVCDDVFVTESLNESPGVRQDATCVELGHGPVLVDADFEWQICHRCRGEGVLRGWPGAYTESDRAEWSDNDYEDYAGTRRFCEDCGGSGKVLELTDAASERPIVQRWFQEEAEYRAEVAAERRMGA